ncbi:12779_t:CDS:2 [Cetraspora pellucida]|uniref:carbonic anhydrase n=1 Tax=Cetraspora pellucida TaxID=1433469 RepID=A0A9N9INF7_9GLOM|nr:12779_t:CDS:2 [Cetraspora pellucida]
MKFLLPTIFLAFLIIGLSFVSSYVLSPREEEKSVWGYLGSNGPAYWHQLNETYGTCKGIKQQTPIDLKVEDFTNSTKIELNVIKPTDLILLNNGHTYQVQRSEGTIEKPALHEDATLKVDGETYYLYQYHFHMPSEHHIEGRDLLLEGHWVFKTSSEQDAKVAVLGVFFDLGERDEPGLEPIVEIIDKQPVEVNDHVNITISLSEQIFKRVKTVYSYDGSFTIPPCTEGIRWFVSSDVQSISPSQFKSLKYVLKYNSRSTQKRLDGGEPTSHGPWKPNID